MPRLRRSDTAAPGIARRRAGRGFVYLEPDGARVRASAVLDRIRALAVPPAWTDVWICRDPQGHIQAVGVDAAGRRQYRYHDEWRQRRDAEKFERVRCLARRLPALRRRVTADLARPAAGPAVPRDRVLAAVVRLLDLGAFRIGNAEYADEHGTFGLTTLLREHVRVRGVELRFDYVAKYGMRRTVSVRDTAVAEVVAALRRRRSGGSGLFVWRDTGRWVDLRSEHVNGYLRSVSGLDVTAKDFRTWHGTVLMALALAADPPAGRGVTARRRAVAAAYREVAAELGNTPAVARASYVDWRVVDRYHEGVTVADLRSLPDPARARRTVELAVLDLLAC